MYGFQSNPGKRRDRQTLRLLRVVVFLLIVALAGVTYSFLKARRVERATADALYARAVSEAGEAQSAVYRLTQSSGTGTASQLATIRSHIYAMKSLNLLAANIYGAGTSLVDEALLDACVDSVAACYQRQQAGLVLTDPLTELRDDVDQVVAAFSGGI